MAAMMMMSITETQHVELAMTGPVEELNANWILSKKIIVTFAKDFGARIWRVVKMLGMT